MMHELIVDDYTIKYQINYKNNKNTYFYFKKSGYIQINASKKQSKRQILKYITQNKEAFLKKINTVSKDTRSNKMYYFFGVEYKKEIDLSIDKLMFDHTNHIVKEPLVSPEKLQSLYKKFEKDTVLEKLSILNDKYINNGLIDINDISLKTRYMTSRFGSCNPKKRNINVNLYLANYEEKFIEYIFLHEITHLNQQNHSKDFYILFSKLCPNHRELKKELNNIFIHR